MILIFTVFYNVTARTLFCCNCDLHVYQPILIILTHMVRRPKQSIKRRRTSSNCAIGSPFRALQLCAKQVAVAYWLVRLIAV